MKHLFLLLAATTLTFNVWAQEFSGSGTADNPYLINNKADLAQLAVLVNNGNTDYRSAAYQLTADIDLAGDNWLPIGNNDYPFQGQFDGDNHTIYNLTIKGTDITYAGLFGRVTSEDSEFKNIKFVGGEIQISSNFTSHAGFLAGWIENGNIDNCSSTGDVTATTTYSFSYAGGLVGQASSSISDCYATGNVTAISSSNSYSSSSAGGLVGESSSFISDCYATGDVTATSSSSYDYFAYAGGLVGRANSHTPSSPISIFYSILRCYATGDVTATSSTPYAGGLVGGIGQSKIGTSVAANNSVTGEGKWSSVGRVVGYMYEADFTNCYHRKTMAVVGTGGFSGQAATASDLTSRAFYVNLGWDMDNIWSIEEGIDLPKLRAIPEQPTSINTPPATSQENNVCVYYDGNSIVIVGANAGETICVYNLSGALVTQTQNIASPTSIAIPQGVYVVKVGNAAFKVISSKF